MINLQKMGYCKLLMIIGILLYSGFVRSQNGAEQNKIEASKGAASALLFNVADSKIPVIKPGHFYNGEECKLRMGMPNFMAKIHRGEAVTVAFIGGSITQGNYCYRLQTAKYLEKHYPEVTFKWVNAGVSGTGTDLGAFRLQEQVLSYHPDLIFIEFAVNGAYQPAMEGMIQQIIKHNPVTDICLLYTILTSQGVDYQRGRIPENIKGLEMIADAYHLPSIQLGMQAADLELKGKLLWKGTVQQAGDRILFSHDGIHPLQAGGNLYAASIARAFMKMETTPEKVPTRHRMPLPLFGNKWQEAKMYAPDAIARLDASWKKFKTDTSSLKAFDGWFHWVVTASTAGASYTFTFKGDMFGLFDIGGPEVGQLEVWVDGKMVGLKKVAEKGFYYYKAVDKHKGDTLLNRFNSFCNNRYRGQFDIIEVSWGEHKITFKISAVSADKQAILGKQNLEDLQSNPERYHKSALLLGRILLRGTPIYNQ